VSKLIKVLRELKRKKQCIVACPKCGGDKVHRSSVFNGWVIPTRYVCDECGYSGHIILEKVDAEV